MHLVRAIGVHAKVGILKDLQYRANFVGNLVNSALGFFLAIGTILVVFRHTHLLGDWTRTELIMLIGVYSVVRGFINLFIRPGMHSFLSDIRTGIFDFVLLKPLDSQVYVAIREFRIWSLFDLLVGVSFIAWSVTVSGPSLDTMHWLLFSLILVAGLAVVVSFWFILGTAAFWFVKIDNIFVVFDTLFQTARWPITIFPGAIRTLLTVVVPVAWAVTMPAAVLANKVDFQSIWVALLVPVFFISAARLFWTFGIRHYSGASA